jgi:hypothetical protein
LFTVPTVSFRVLFVMVALAHHRRRIVHFNVTANPTAVWTAQQVVEAFPEESAPRFLIRDRDQIYGEEFCQRVKGMGIEDVITAAPESLAKSIRGEGDWESPARVPRPCDRGQ